MSLLAVATGRTLSRVSTATVTSTSKSLSGITILLESRRYASRNRYKAASERRKAGVKRDSSGKPIQLKKERTPPLFTPISRDQLGKDHLFEVDTLENFNYSTFLPKSLTKESIGLAMQFSTSKEANEARRQLGLPKTIWKEFKLLETPVSVVRGVTLDAVNILDEVQNKGLASKDTRMIFSGRSGSGKSYLLLQAVESCLANDWIVLYIPRAVNLVNSTTPYTYDLRTQTFFQPEAAFQIIHRARVVNQKKLKALHLAEPLVMDDATIQIPAGTSLFDLLDVTRQEVGRAPIVLDAFLKELEKQTASPVLLAIDDFQALFTRSSYRDPHFKPVASYHLHTPRILLDYTSGRRSFTKGAVLGALTASDPNFPISIELSDVLGVATASQQPVAPEPLVMRSGALKGYLDGVRSLQVPNNLSVTEAESIFEVWMKQRALVSNAHDELFMSKYVESAGNPRDFVWKGLLGTLQT